MQTVPVKVDMEGAVVKFDESIEGVLIVAKTPCDSQSFNQHERIDLVGREVLLSDILC